MPRQSDVSTPSSSSSSDSLTSVDRAISDIRRGGRVCVKLGGQHLMVAAAEAMTLQAFDLLNMSSTFPPKIVITGQRARVLGLSTDADAGLCLVFDSGLDVSLVQFLADPFSTDNRQNAIKHLSQYNATELEQTCLTLVKLARLLPAAIITQLEDIPVDMLSVHAEHIQQYQNDSALSLQIVSHARVPLEATEHAKLIAFRPADGGIEHIAIVVGEPDVSNAVLLRIHSECFTGDLLGSIRCDCGEQLRGAIAEMARAGSGIILYLAQEGRGIGLINKLRAYQLQDAGLDTIDANLQLGFDEDERIYLPAAQMLKLLGIQSVKLLTNNPIKVAAMIRHGVDVVERLPHQFPTNEHNEQYLNTKAVRAGHLL